MIKNSVSFSLTEFMLYDCFAAVQSAVAPFIGAFLSFILLHESLTIVYLIALAVMIAGTAFVVSDTLKQK